MFNSEDRKSRLNELMAFDPRHGKFSIRSGDLFGYPKVQDSPWAGHNVFVVSGHAGIEDGKNVMRLWGSGERKTLSADGLADLLQRDPEFLRWKIETEGTQRGILITGCQSKNIAEVLARALAETTWGADVNSQLKFTDIMYPGGKVRLVIPQLAPGGKYHQFQPSSSQVIA